MRGQILLGVLAGHQSEGGEQWVRVVSPNVIGVLGLLVLSIFSLLSQYFTLLNY